jgi:hypothetical protein
MDYKLEDFEIAYLATDTYAIDIETDCNGILPVNTQVRIAGQQGSKVYFYVEDSQGWGLNWARFPVTFKRSLAGGYFNVIKNKK